jgi:hypothetical protein
MGLKPAARGERRGVGEEAFVVGVTSGGHGDTRLDTRYKDLLPGCYLGDRYSRRLGSSSRRTSGSPRVRRG